MVLLMYFRLLSGWVTTMITICILCIPISAVLFFLLKTYIHHRAKRLFPELRQHHAKEKKPVVVGFFHPYCNAGGGGERVLWTAIRALQIKYSHFRCVVYTGDTDATGEEILRKAQQRFNIALPRTGPKDLQFVFLFKRQWVEASPYPILTLLGQSFGSIVLGAEALLKYVPDIYLDTMGYAFTLPLFKYLGGCSVGCYVHYPTISTEMLQRVSARSASYNNSSFISRSPILSSAKIVYYKLFAYIYGVAGKRSDIIMVNSTWTQGHIGTIWKAYDRTHIVYPPCDVKEFIAIPLKDDEKVSQYSIASLGQFRPEKDHPLQIKSFAKFLSEVPGGEKSYYKLVLVGGCRNEEDETRVEGLRQLCKELDLADYVDFRLNVSFAELKKCLSEATVGLHTMWNEHFGIGVVECMAAGTVMLAHDSGGPQLDIVKAFNGQRTGFLASDVDSYALALKTIFSLSAEERLAIRTNARESVTRFSESEFEAGFLSITEPLISAN